MHSGLYFNMIWIASIGSSSGPQAYPIFAICFFTSSNEKHSTDPSVVGNSTSCSLGVSALKSLSKCCFNVPLIFPDSVKMIPSSLTYAMPDISLLLLSLVLASLYNNFAPYLVSSLVYNSSYFSCLVIATALFTALLASFHAQCCSPLIYFWYALSSSS